MQVPKRQSEQRRKYRETDAHMSAGAIAELKNELRRLEEASRPWAVEELARTRQMGDLSENAAYSEAKGRLSGIDTRIFHLKERLKSAVLVEPGADSTGAARIGATVVLEIAGRERTYEITGSSETDPASGRISHRSPLGSALLGKRAGDDVTVEAGGKEIVYRIKLVR